MNLVVGLLSLATALLQQPLDTLEASVLGSLGFAPQDLLPLSSLKPGLRASIESLILQRPYEFAAKLHPPPLEPQTVLKRSDFDIIIKSPKFPNYQIRARDPAKLGVDKVRQWSGYIDVLDQDKHFFFWFFESRSQPKNDPFLMWLNGGPGCSSAIGQFLELGPSSVDENGTLHYNPFSWNDKANLLFLDQPVNAGFSYSGQRIDSTTVAAEDVYSFLSLFVHHFDEYAHLPFSIAGESYGGHYVPAIGHEIIKHDDRNFNFSSIMIGNGITDFFNQEESKVHMSCGLAGFPSVIDPKECEDLYKNVLPKCQQSLAACYEYQTPLICTASDFFCRNTSVPYCSTGRNPYDVRQVCHGECYPEMNYQDSYLNRPEVQKELGVETIEFIGCKDDMGQEFRKKGDVFLPFQHSVAALLEYGIPVLVYAGDKDFICAWTGQREWTNKLPWVFHDEYASAETRKWYVHGQAAGEIKSYGGLSFMRVYDSGHFVPYDKPKEGLQLVEEWLSGGAWTTSSGERIVGSY